MQDPAQLFEDLMNIEMVAMLNEAFCEMHHKPYCPPSEEVIRECGKVRTIRLLVTLYCVGDCEVSHCFVVSWYMLSTSCTCCCYHVMTRDVV